MKLISLHSPYRGPKQRLLGFQTITTFLRDALLARRADLFVGEILSREVILRTSSGEGLDGSRWGASVIGDNVELISDTGPAYDERSGRALRCLRVRLPVFSLVSYRITHPGRRPERRVDLALPPELAAYLREVLVLEAPPAVQRGIINEAYSTLANAWQNALQTEPSPASPPNSAIIN